MITNRGLLGIGLPPPPPPPPPPPWPMIWPPYQPSPTVYVERRQEVQIEAPCKWYQDLESVGDSVYCCTPATWLVIAAAGATTLLVILSRGRR
jgi:hypothetical protein